MHVITGILLSARKKALDPRYMFWNMWASWNLSFNVSVYLHEINCILCPGQDIILPLTNQDTMDFSSLKFQHCLQIQTKLSKGLGN